MLAVLLAACGSLADRPSNANELRTPVSARATGVLVTAAPAATRTPTVVPTPEPAFPALRALEIALPELRQRHPRGLVMGVSGTTEVSNRVYVDHVREWVIDVWAPELGRRRQYSVQDGVLRGAATSSTIPPGGLAHVMALADERPPVDVMDSDRAIALADAAGAAEFKQGERAQLRPLALSGNLNGSLDWNLFISRIADGPDPGISITVEVDARSGAVLRFRDGRVQRTATAAAAVATGTPRP